MNCTLLVAGSKKPKGKNSEYVYAYDQRAVLSGSPDHSFARLYGCVLFVGWQAEIKLVHLIFELSEHCLNQFCVGVFDSFHSFILLISCSTSANILLNFFAG